MKASYMSKQTLTHAIAHANKVNRKLKKQKERKGKNRKLSYSISSKKYFLLLIENSVLAIIK